MNELPVKSKHAALLNALFEMQHAMAYKMRHSVLAEAEAVIVDMERVERLQQERITELEKLVAQAQKEAGFARLAYDQLSERYAQGIERAKGRVSG